MDYSKLSDFEINKAVAQLEFKNSYSIQDEPASDADPKCSVEPEFGAVNISVDYCNNPNDAWPVILNNAIQMNYDTCEVHCDSYFAPSAGKVSAPHKRALRAAMIVYLKMKAA